MKPIPAIYEDGSIFFGFQYPEYFGPVSVLVIFPEANDLEYFEDYIEAEELDLEGPAPPNEPEFLYWDPEYEERLDEIF